MEFRVGSAPARSVGFSHGNTTVFDAGSEPPLVSVCVFDFQEVALLYKQGNSPLVCSVVSYPALKWFEEVRCG